MNRPKNLYRNNTELMSAFNAMTENSPLSIEAKLSFPQISALFYDNPVPSIIVDLHDGRILDNNRKFAEVFESANADNRHQTLFELGSYSDISEIRQTMNSPRFGEKGAILKLNNRRDELHSYKLIGRPIEYESRSCLLCLFEKIEDSGGQAGISSGERIAAKQSIQPVARQESNETAIRESETKYRSLFETATDAIFLENENEEILDVNEAACRLVGYTRAELLSLKTRDLEPSDIRDEPLLDIYKNPDIKNIAPIEKEVQHKDGRRVPTEFTITSFRAGGRIFFMSLLRDITERKKIEAEARQAHFQLEQIFQAAMPMIFIAKDCTMLNINDTYSEKFKVDKSSLIGKKCFEFYPGHLCKTSRCPIKRILSGTDRYEYEDISRLDDGTEIISIASAVPLKGPDGEILGIVESFTDISERKKAERALKANEIFSRAVIEKSPLGVSVRSRSGKLLSCNDAWKKIWGKSAEEIRAYINAPERKEFQFDTRDNYLREWHDDIKRIYTEGGYFHVPEAKLMYYKKGGDRWVSQHFYAIKSSHDKVDRVVILTEDITERRRIELALKESERKFKEALKHSRDMLYRLNLQTMSYDYFSESIYPLIGYTPDEICKLGVNGIRNLAHPDDLKRIGNHRESLINSEIGEQESFITEYRIRCKDGNYKWLSDSHALVRDRQGKPEYIIGSVRDITANRLAEEAISESEEKFRTVVSASKDAMIAINQDGTIILFNPAAEKLFGYSQAELLGQAPDKLMPEEFRELFRTYVKGYFSSGEYCDLFGKTFEVFALNNSAEKIPVEISVSVGETDGHRFALAVIRDVSDRKKADQALKDSEERYRLLVENAGQPIFTVSYKGEFLTLNNIAAQYQGGLPRDFIGKTMWDLFDKEYADIHMSHIREVIDSGTKMVREQKTRIRDEERWFIISIQPLFNIKDNVQTKAALLIANDITLRKRLETREQAKSRLLDNLRKIKTISESLNMCCETILEAGLYSRVILTIHNNQQQIISYGFKGFDFNEVKGALKASTPSQELSNKFTQEKFKISHSYFIPADAGMLQEIEARCISEQAIYDPGTSSWQPGDALFVPLMNEKDEPEGWLSVDTPFSGRRPSYDDVVYLEELVDIIGKHVRQIRSLELLENERKALKDKNITLREVLAYLEEEKMEIRRQVADEVENTLIPVVKRLVKTDGSLNKTCYNILNSSLQALAAQSGRANIYSKLSPREIEICNLIKNGASTKDIGAELNISPATVQKHRESIRRKLGVTNKNINLVTFLKG